MNLAEQYAAFKQRALQAYNATEDDTYPYAHIFTLFSEANLTVNRRLDIARAINTQSVTAGTAQFARSAGAERTSILLRQMIDSGIAWARTNRSMGSETASQSPAPRPTRPRS